MEENYQDAKVALSKETSQILHIRIPFQPIHTNANYAKKHTPKQVPKLRYKIQKQLSAYKLYNRNPYILCAQLEEFKSSNCTTNDFSKLNVNFGEKRI